MSNLRIIPRLDIKGKNLIKGIHLEGLRVLGDPNEFALSYYNDGADELIYMDCVASLYGRNNLLDIVERSVENIFIPITVGGGIRSVDDANKVLRAGADKVAVNTAAISDPKLISRIANHFGSQCMVLSVEAKRMEGGWEAFTDNGRERTGRQVISWIKEAVELGAGEVLLTSVDQEGTEKGYDIELLDQVVKAVNVPVITSGGFRDVEDIKNCFTCGSDAIAVASMLHYKKMNIREIKELSQANKIPVRPLS